MNKNQPRSRPYVFANGFGLRLGDNDVTLTFGMNEGTTPDETEIGVAVVMTPRTLKMMVHTLAIAIERFETEYGEITVPPEKLPPTFEEMVKGGSAGIGKKPA